MAIAGVSEERLDLWDTALVKAIVSQIPQQLLCEKFAVLDGA
jgi:hypothetical protein